VRQSGGHLHGIQSWVALPISQEEAEPSFEHHPSATIPKLTRAGAVLDVIAGSALGATSPVKVLSPTLYVHALLDDEAVLELDAEHEERAVYVSEGLAQCDGRTFGVGTMFVLRPGVTVSVTGKRPATRLMIVGGAKLDGERHVYWNFVSSSKERIERAKEDWRRGAFARVPGDEVEFIPLPES
jgi:redox-sensitive bicupin YhaK (pirin superfamily)